MKVFYGSNSGNHYIICKESQEKYVFDSFGNYLNSKASINDCNNWVEVDYISIVNVGVNDCELLYSNHKAVLGIPMMVALKRLMDLGNYKETVFSIKHNDDLGVYHQVIILFPKNVSINSFIELLFPNKLWTPLQIV